VAERKRSKPTIIENLSTIKSVLVTCWFRYVALGFDTDFVLLNHRRHYSTNGFLNLRQRFLRYGGILGVDFDSVRKIEFNGLDGRWIARFLAGKSFPCNVPLKIAEIALMNLFSLPPFPLE
jgi:hypothetical protein